MKLRARQPVGFERIHWSGKCRRFRFNGFAVVAQEIRKLAVRSKELTNQIAGIIEEIKQKSDRLSDEVEISKEVGKRQTQLINSATKSTEDVYKNTEQLISTSERIKHSNDSLNEI